MAASEYYTGSPGLPLNYRPYNHHPAAPYTPSLSGTFNEDFGYQPYPKPSRPSKPYVEPLIYDYEPGYHKPPKRPSAIYSFIYNWWLCIGSVFLSGAALTAIVLLLIFVDDKPLPKLPLSITVNTYVSFFATIAKASMLVAVADSISQLKWLWFRQPRNLQDIQIFDDASRGPMGALWLIIRTRGVRLAALGSLVTVLSPFMDPFTQQIVSYPSRSVIVGRASVGRAQVYDAGLSLQTLESGLLIGPEWGMKAAIYDGIFKPAAVEHLPPTCSTGNCTFPLFDSLAFCSKCLDVTNDVIINNPKSDTKSLRGFQNISYSLPGDAVVNFSVLFEEGNLAMGPSIVSTSDLPSGLSKTVLGLQDPLLSLAILQFPDVRQRVADGNYFTSLPKTHECALYFCINTYNVSVLNNIAITDITSTWTSETGTPTAGRALQANAMNGTQDATLILPSSSSTMPANHTYSVPAGSLANLKAWLNNTMQGTMNTTFSRVKETQWVNDEVQALNGTTDWDGLMNAIAVAMSTYIRTPSAKHPPSATNTVEGQAYKMEIYVHVQWYYLGLPIGLVGSSIVFLVATMLVNERKKAAAWKSSSLALLFHGLEGVRGGGGVREMRRIARNTRVVLSRSLDGEWKLINTG